MLVHRRLPGGEREREEERREREREKEKERALAGSEATDSVIAEYFRVIPAAKTNNEPNFTTASSISLSAPLLFSWEDCRLNRKSLKNTFIKIVICKRYGFFKRNNQSSRLSAHPAWSVCLYIYIPVCVFVCMYVWVSMWCVFME